MVKIFIHIRQYLDVMSYEITKKNMKNNNANQQIYHQDIGTYL